MKTDVGKDLRERLESCRVLLTKAGMGRFGLILVLAICGVAFAQGPSDLQGRVLDPSGAVIAGAKVVVKVLPGGGSREATTKADGRFEIRGLTPGHYSVTAEAAGFRAMVQEDVALSAGQTLKLELRLAVEAKAEQVTVNGQNPGVQTAPQENASAVVVSGNDLNAISNDPDLLQNQIAALAGPSVGAGGAEIYINGVTGADMPAKSEIREIRVNENPFSADNHRLGYGRVDISTKPGSAEYHGEFSSEYNDSHLNAVSPFLAASGEPRPSYHTWLWDGDLGGPLGKRTSFFFAFQRRNINRASLVNTDILDSSLNIVPYLATVPNPRIQTNISPRVDVQISANNTLSVNYRYRQIGERNDGVDTQSLASQGYDRKFYHNNVQVIDTQVLSPQVVNQTTFQYLHFHDEEVPQETTPTVTVLGAFTAGGSSAGTFNRYETHYTAQNYTTMTRGHHVFRFGATLLDLPRSEATNGGFNGAFTFNSLADYQQTLQGLQSGLTMAQIQAAGYGPSQFNITAGQLWASINRVDGAVFANDDWTILPQLTASYGVRFESENMVSDHADWAPRVGLAWGLGHGPKVKTVLRAGWGIFYTRLDDDHMMIAERLNGQNQQTYLINNPEFFPTVPPLEEITSGATSAPTVFRLAPNLRSPYDIDTSVSLERQVTRAATVSLTYLNSRGLHWFLANDINAPLPGTFNPNDPTSGVRPLGNAAGNIYDYESIGVYRQTQVIANVRVNASRVSLFGYYVYDNAHGNSGLNVQSSPAGDFSFQTNPWNLAEDYGRSSFDIRHRVVVGGSCSLPMGFRFSPMFLLNSGQPFSILLPQDLYGTGVYDARPAYATASTPASDLVVTKYGAFNVAPGAGDRPIPPNSETGPTNFMLNFRLSRTFGLGGGGKEKHGGEESAPGEEGENRGLGGRGLSGKGREGLGGATKRRYALTVGVSVLNALNTANYAPPVNVLGSPLFGQSIALATGPFSAQAGNPVANRVVNVSVGVSF